MTESGAGTAKGRFGGWNALSLLAAFLLVFSFQLTVGLYRPPVGSLSLDEPVTVALDGEGLGGGALPILFSSGSDPGFRAGTYRFVLEFRAGESTFRDEDLLLVLPHISGSSLEAWLNGVPLGLRGDPVRGRSNLWNTVHVLPIGAGVLRLENKLELDILGSYEAGISLRPYIVDEKSSSGIFLLLLLSNYLIWIIVGALIAISLIILSMGVCGGAEQSASILLGFAGICAAAILLDFAYIERLPCSLVAFKRFVICARHLGAAIFIIAYAKILKKRLDPVSIGFAGLQGACLLLVLFYPGNIIVVKRLYSWTYLVFIPFQVYLLYLILFSERVDRGFRILVFGVATAFLGSVRDIICLVLLRDQGILMISQYGFMVLALTSAVFVVDDSLVRFRDLVAMRHQAKGLREESLGDSLTTAYNRKILPILAKDLDRPYAVLVVDLDDLKVINDEYGHPTGDAILVDLVRVLRHNTRSRDMVIRVGGDEFVVVLRSCPLKIACEIAERLEADCAKAAVPVIVPGENRPEFLGNLSYSISIGIAIGEGEGGTDLAGLTSTISKADSRMYKAKQGGKGGVVS